jgi:hypothetical protein
MAIPAGGPSARPFFVLRLANIRRNKCERDKPPHPNPIALIDHPGRTLNGKEIEKVVSQTLAREAMTAAWRRTIGNAGNFTAFDGEVPRQGVQFKCSAGGQAARPAHDEHT